MITNERQYRTTRIQARKFRDAIDKFDPDVRKKNGIDPVLIDAELDGMKSQFETLRQEIADYDVLKSLTFPMTESGIRELLVPLVGDQMWATRAILMVTPVIMALCELRDKGEIRLDARTIQDFLYLGKGLDKDKPDDRKTIDDIRTRPGMIELYLRAVSGDLSMATQLAMKGYFDTIPGFSLEKAINGEIQESWVFEHHSFLAVQLIAHLESISHYLDHLIRVPCVIKIECFEDLGRGLIKARIASGLSQKALAERMGLKEQQIQRYEAKCYSSAGFSRLVEISKALKIRFNTGFILPMRDARQEIPVKTQEIPVETQEIPVKTQEIPVEIQEIPVET